LPPPKKTTTRQAWKADTTLTSPAWQSQGELAYAYCMLFTLQRKV
jgi:hypothetical protein